jgi:thiamine-monophosphate kinase
MGGAQTKESVVVIEEDQIHALFRSAFQPRRGLSGPGDDCATLRPPAGKWIVQSVDQLIEGVHVEMGTPPRVMAKKLVGRSLSDLAAAGAQPWACQWTVVAPSKNGQVWMSSLCRAFLKASNSYGMPVIGGDLSSGSAVVLTCTVMGLVDKKPPGRSGAKVGDVLLVTGKLGFAVRSGRHLHPQPRLALGKRLIAKYAAHAMMDLSDGLATDLPRLARASKVKAEVKLDSIPCHHPGDWQAALGDGEDYELLVALSPRGAKKALADPSFAAIGLTQIGKVRDGRGVAWKNAAGENVTVTSGWKNRWGS